MHSTKKILHRLSLYAASILLLGGMPTIAHATDEPATYTYDTSNQRWNTDTWVYDSTTGVYVPASTAVATAPQTQKNSTEELQQTAPENSSQNSQPGTSTNTSEAIDASQDTSVTSTKTIDNMLNSESVSGSASVVSNVRAGDATTGQADTQSTTVNSVHSTINGDTQGIAHFTTDIYGDVTGDITIGPSIDNATVNNSLNIQSNTKVRNNDSISNSLNASAVSGDANINNNTVAGNAKSGNANAVANVLNLINTIIAANKSFVGTINIHGNLNGDILVSPDFIPQLLASNADNKVNISMPLGMTPNSNDDQSIINNIKLQATSGNANIKDNTGGGNATTGTSNTNLTVLNLTGHEIDAKKSLLVFVNVLGKWVGMIVDAPGATAAAFGSGVLSDRINMTNTTDFRNSSQILNNIHVAAKSGDANIVNNTQAGNATTGNATASANIANISTSTIKLSDWFGILFINVFGTWIGSFGIDTNAGTVVPLSGMALTNNQSLTNSHHSSNFAFGFIPKNIKLTKLASILQNTRSGNEIDKQSLLSLASANDQSFPPDADLLATHSSSVPQRTHEPLSPLLTVAGLASMVGLSSALMINRRRHKDDSLQAVSGLSLRS